MRRAIIVNSCKLGIGWVFTIYGPIRAGVYANGGSLIFEPKKRSDLNCMFERQSCSYMPSCMFSISNVGKKNPPTFPFPSILTPLPLMPLCNLKRLTRLKVNSFTFLVSREPQHQGSQRREAWTSGVPWLLLEQALERKEMHKNMKMLCCSNMGFDQV